MNMVLQTTSKARNVYILTRELRERMGNSLYEKEIFWCSVVNSRIL